MQEGMCTCIMYGIWLYRGRAQIELDLKRSRGSSSESLIEAWSQIEAGLQLTLGLESTHLRCML